MTDLHSGLILSFDGFHGPTSQSQTLAESALVLLIRKEHRYLSRVLWPSSFEMLYDIDSLYHYLLNTE